MNGGRNAPIITGVENWQFTPCEEWARVAANVRARECRLASLLPGGWKQEKMLRLQITEGVTGMREQAADRRTETLYFCENCLSLRGCVREGRARRDMRERARVLAWLRRDARLPRMPDELLALWEEANWKEPRVYDDLPAHFRREADPVPFSQGSFFFDRTGEVPPGYGTVPPAGILRETEKLLDWLQTGADREILAAGAFFLLGRIHPFADGNGHTLRMLTCGLLDGNYSEATLLFFVSRLQALRGLIASEERETNEKQKDLSDLGCLLLRVMILAQDSLERAVSASKRDGTGKGADGKWP